TPKPASPASALRGAEARGCELGKGAGAVADGMLPGRLQLPEGQGLAVGNEHRIIAETAGSARRPDEVAVNLALEHLMRAVRPGQAQGAGEVGPAIAGVEATPALKLPVDPLHGRREILARAGPACGVDAGLAVQALDLEP